MKQDFINFFKALGAGIVAVFVFLTIVGLTIGLNGDRSFISPVANLVESGLVLFGTFKIGELVLKAFDKYFKKQ